MRAAYAALVWLICSACLAQAPQIVAPERADPYTLVVVSCETTAKFVSLKVRRDLFSPIDVRELQPAGKARRWVWTAPPGKYLVEVQTFDPEGGIGDDAAVVTIGTPQPVPPPGPGPGPDPTPTPTPPTTGPRTVLILRETRDASPAEAQAIAQLRTGPHATYLREKGHRLWVLDDDSVGPNGNPVLADWIRAAGGVSLPALVISEGEPSRKILYVGGLPITADAIMAQLKQAGG